MRGEPRQATQGPEVMPKYESLLVSSKISTINLLIIITSQLKFLVMGNTQ